MGETGAPTVTASMQVSTCGSDRSTGPADLQRFEEAKAARNLGKSRVMDGSLVLAATLLGGSGLLGIPHAFASAGWLLGSLLLATFGLLSAFGSHLLQCSARKIGQAPCTFYTAAEAVVPNWTWLIDGAVAIKCFGVATSYLTIVGDLAPPAIHHFGLQSIGRWQILLIGWAIGGSLALLKNLSALRYSASGSIIIVLWTAVMLVLFFFSPGESELGTFAPCMQDPHPDVRPCGEASFKPFSDANWVTLVKAFPVFIFGFTCQQNVFSVCNEVKNASRRRIDVAILCAYMMAGLCFTLAAFFGYATYGDKVDSNVLKGYPQNNVVQVTRVLYSFVAIFSYPLQIHPARISFLALVDTFCGNKCHRSQRQMSEGFLSEEESPRPTFGQSRVAFGIVTVILLVGSLSIALVVKDLGRILGVVGATGSTTVSYILPGLVYTQAHTQPSVERKMAWVQLALGCVIMPVCLVIVFVN